MSKSINNVLVKLNKILPDDRGLVCSFISILSGLVFGSVVAVLPEHGIKSEILSVFLSFNTDFADKTKTEILSGFVLSGLIYFALLFLFGGNVFGKELVLIITSLKASGITAIIAFLYAEYSLKGLEYTLLVFLPGKAVFFFAMLFMTKSAYDFSGRLRRGLRDKDDMKIHTRLFCLKVLISFVVFALSWLIDFACICIFSGLFSFYN